MSAVLAQMHVWLVMACCASYRVHRSSEVLFSAMHNENREPSCRRQRWQDRIGSSGFQGPPEGRESMYYQGAASQYSQNIQRLFLEIMGEAPNFQQDPYKIPRMLAN